VVLRFQSFRARRALVVLAIIALCSAWFAVAAHQSSAALNGKILIVDTSLATGSPAPWTEVDAATSLGLTTDVVDATTWNSMTTAQFAQYRAIVFADGYCANDSTVALAAPIATLSTWVPAVTGNVIVHNFDSVDHANDGNNSDGAKALTTQGIAFAVADTAHTGMYLSSSCYGSSDTGWLTLLDAISPGWDRVRNSANTIHVTGSTPALAPLADATLSDFHSSTHNYMTSWPSDFTVFAIATGKGVAAGADNAPGDVGAQATITGPYTAPDGTQGAPVILIRGADTSPSHILLTPATQTHDVGGAATLTATVKLQDGTPAGAGITVTFTATAGPNVGTILTATTNASGVASITYPGLTAGTDTWAASFVDTLEVKETSNTVVAIWTTVAVAPAVEVAPRFTG